MKNSATPVLKPEQKKQAMDFFRLVQDKLLAAFCECDPKAKLERKSWDRPEVTGDSRNGGGGIIGVVRGPAVEKAGANFSEVYGDSYPAIENKYKDKAFFATGVSTIGHMYNPQAPIAHMNVRLLEVGDEFWFGGGADLTPFIAYEEDTKEFHQVLEKACMQLGADTYAKYKAWCDEYFYIPHRKSPRGVGGIFFDYLQGDFTRNFAFVQAVALAYVDIYARILKRRLLLPFTPEQKDGQLYWRGRYAEFNLVYDRGTKFGLMTGGNVEAIFVSLPPEVKW